MRFSGRVVSGTVLVLVFAIVVLIWSAYRSLGRDLERQEFEDLGRMAGLVKAAIGDDPGAWHSQARTLGVAHGIRITVIDSSGNVLADSDIPNPDQTVIENHLGRPEVQAALSGGSGTARRNSSTVGAEFFYVAVRGGPGVVRVAREAAVVQGTIQRTLRSVTFAALLALLVGTVLAYAAASSVTRPIRALASAARAIAAGNLPRFPRSGVPEIDALVVSLREMNRQLAERFEELRREQSESAALVTSMVEGVIASDARGRVATANPAARTMLGYGPDEPMPDMNALFKEKEARDLVATVIAGEAATREITLDGAVLLASGRPLPTGGAVLVLHDLTDLRRLERARSDFVANASHELKTPLTSIAGYSETLLGDDPDPETRRRFLSAIHANARRMQALVDDLLDLSRIESGRWQPRPETQELGSLAEDEWSALAGRGNRSLDLAIPPDASRVKSDPQALRQILRNLMENSIRHTEDDGSITVSARTEGAGVEISVTDDGTGILSDHLPRIFERFYRADEARSRDHGGTGLGLSIVKHLVEAHGGRVAAASVYGQGTTIRFWLPA